MWYGVKRWVGLGLAITFLCLAGKVEARADAWRAAQPEPVSLDAVAQAHPTPQALARFLRQTFTFQPDDTLFGEPDYWQTPEEFLARRRGDCEDYALFVQAILQRQGIEACVLSVFGEGGYAHTVCAFAQSGRYGVFNQDRLRLYETATLERLPNHLYPAWTYGAVARQVGRRGQAVRLIRNPNPSSNPPFWRSDNLFSFP